MSKDWKVECAELKGQIKELKSEIARLQSAEEHRYYAAQGIRDKFKELLIEVLGK